MLNSNLVLWVYIVLLVIGGLIGFLKANSKVSLIVSCAFAAALALCAINFLPPPTTDIILAALLIVFAVRLSKGKKFMPSGLMLILTIAALALRHIHF